MTTDVSTSAISTTLMKVALCAVSALVLLAPAACRSRAGGEEEAARSVVIVNAPATGEVRRVLVREGMTVSEGMPIVEIAVRTEVQSTPQNRNENPLARAGRSVSAAQSEIETARAEVVRAEVEVQRLTPLVAAGQATQGELDGARAMYDRAQQRLRQAQDAAQRAQSGLVVARQQSQNAASTTAAPSEKIVAAIATSAGTVSVVNARVGEHVTSGQPLATLRADRR